MRINIFCQRGVWDGANWYQNGNKLHQKNCYQSPNSMARYETKKQMSFDNYQCHEASHHNNLWFIWFAISYWGKSIWCIQKMMLNFPIDNQIYIVININIVSFQLMMHISNLVTDAMWRVCWFPLSWIFSFSLGFIIWWRK